MPRIIVSEELEKIEPWDYPDVKGVPFNPTARSDKIISAEKPAATTPNNLPESKEEIQKQAYDSAYQDYQQEYKKKLQLIDQIQHKLFELSQEIEATVVDEMMELVQAIVKKVLREEMKLEKEKLRQLINESVRLLPPKINSLEVLLNPQDAEWLQTQKDLPANWKIAADTALHVGECRIKTDTALVDATLEHRLTQIWESISHDPT